MTQQRGPRRRKKNKPLLTRRAFLAGAGAAAAGLAAWQLWPRLSALQSPAAPAEPNPALPAGEWRAAWVSYLEWAEMDFSSQETFRAGAAQLMDNCAALGLNTVLAQVRPFGDALYPSRLYPWSHLCTGTQGQDPGFDPLDILITGVCRWKAGSTPTGSGRRRRSPLSWRPATWPVPTRIGCGPTRTPADCT